jgi:hypothetical protein
VRLLPESGGDFYEKCRILGPKAAAKDAADFTKEKEKIEAFRKIFYYIGEYNTCSACRLAETRILSPRPPSYFPAPPETDRRTSEESSAEGKMISPAQ